jgi:hypothetical protein
MEVTIQQRVKEPTPPEYTSFSFLWLYKTNS